jgi:cobaltochelatase CobN
VDVTIQTSCIMRDMVPNFCDLLDRAVTLLSDLEEPDDRNFIRKHTREQMDALRKETAGKMETTRLKRMASLRVFSSAPGTYGTGVGLALDASAWNNAADLAETHINWTGHAYGKDSAGIAAHDLLARQLSGIDVAYMKQASAEYDLLDCDGYAVCQGGMALTAGAVGNKSPRLYWGDATAPGDEDVRDLSMEIARTATAKLLNPAWVEHLKRHGYQGAQNAASRVNTLFKWSATTGEVEKGIFDGVVALYINNEENREWLRRTNPYAMEEITRRLLEAASRDLWAADDNLLAAVQSTALEIEGDMEETMGSVTEEFQGSKVEVLTAGDVEKWQPKWRLRASEENGTKQDLQKR